MKALLILSLLLLANFATPSALAAESYDNCTGYITSVPATISTQGTWCMKSDMSTNIISGAAITIATNNVTLDCNDFKLGGLASGLATASIGIQASSRNSITVRHCNVRGFAFGAEFDGGGASVTVEDNVFYGSTFAAVSSRDIDGLVIRRNIMTDVGGSTVYNYPSSMEVYDGSGTVISDNIITGTTAPAPSSSAAAIFLTSQGAVISDNRISAVLATGTGKAIGVYLASPYVKLIGNVLDNIRSDTGTAVGVWCSANTVLRDTLTSRVNGATFNPCIDGGGNIHAP